jgi:signal transduction histidine kinase
MFRVLQESLVNVHRHSAASAVDIRLERSPESVMMKLSDDGHGIALELLERPQTTHANTCQHLGWLSRNVGTAGII